MTRVKEFYNSNLESMDSKINGFLKTGYREYIDLKLTGVNNTFSTQCDYVAISVYDDKTLEDEFE